MCHYLLFETLALIDGQFRNSEFHQQRIQIAFSHYLKAECYLFLDKIEIPKQYKTGFFRCRIDYNKTQFKIYFSPYIPKEIATFHCVNTENFDYQFKYTDRKRLDNLKYCKTDEIIIINNGFVSDCTIGNLLFLKKEIWYSPQHYLLKGTQLSYLLSQHKIELAPIKKQDIFLYEKIMMINALNHFDSARAIAITPHSVLI